MDPDIDTFSSLPPALQERILREVQPADAEGWAHQPIPSFGGRSFLDVYREGDAASIDRYLEEVHDLLHTAPVHGDAPSLKDDADRIDGGSGVAVEPLLIRPSFRSPTAALWAIGRLPLALLVIGVVLGIEGVTTAELAIRIALVFALGAILSSGYVLGAAVEARPDGALVRHFAVGGLSRRYPRGTIERVRLSDADVTNPRWYASAAFIGPIGQQRFRLYLNYWSPHQIAALAERMRYEVFDDRAKRDAERVPGVRWDADEQRWRPSNLVLVMVIAFGVAASVGLLVAGARL